MCLETLLNKVVLFWIVFLLSSKTVTLGFKEEALLVFDIFLLKQNLTGSMKRHIGCCGSCNMYNMAVCVSR